MIAKAVEGRGFRGAIAYDLGKDAGRILDTNMAGESVPELSAEFGAIRKLRRIWKRPFSHMFANRVTHAGEVVSDSKDYERQGLLMRSIEREFHLQAQSQH